MNIALLTCSKLHGLTDDDHLLLQPLKTLGIDTTIANWDDLTILWNEFDLVVIRSTWDYHYRSDEFVRWIESRKTDGTRLWNQPDTILWNLNKSYLLEMERDKTRIVPTVLISKNGNAVLKEIMKECEWKKAVVKPDISASSFKTWVVDTDPGTNEYQIELDRMLKESGVLIQEFRQEVLDRGEWSLVFFDKTFSHAVLKIPAPGNFKVQQECGGTTRKLNPPLEILDRAQEILQRIEPPLLYARVDGIETKDGFLLMEVELIEPGLFLKYSEQAAEKFASAIFKQISNRH